MSAQDQTPIRVLCLDGGGIRGLVTIRMMESIEKAAGRPIKDCFDWIAGTSTGAIIALCIARGVSVERISELYHTMKVFEGSPPYSTEKIETMLKETFGVESVMGDITDHKVMVTSVMADTSPAELHMFRSYKNPQAKRDTTDEPIWKAARASGAAPFYFHPVDCFLDGGLMANNPTLDALAEIQDYYKGNPPLACVVSLGTGWGPRTPSAVPNFFWPPSDIKEWLEDAVSLKSAVNLLMTLVTASEGRPVDLARAWCKTMKVPFYRYNLELSQEVPLNATDEKMVEKMEDEAKSYMKDQEDSVKELGDLLVKK